MKARFYILIFYIILQKFSFSQFYQGSYQEYGKNRVQYNGFSWKSHNYKRFKIYYSGANEDLAVYVARTMNHYLEDAQTKLDYIFPEKMEVIVYESQNKFRQSNLGLNNDEMTELAGNSTIVGSSVFVYFTGDREEFNQQIKSTVYEVMIKHMFLGSDWKNLIKSNISSDIPFWLEKGLINYMVVGWDSHVESRLKDLILTKKIYKFNNLSPEEKIIAGHATWNYIAESYGNASITSILNITRITNDLERSLFSVINLDYNSLSNNYINFYKKRYSDEYIYQKEAEGDEFNFKRKKDAVYYSFKLSPDEKNLLYVENLLGRYKVKIFNKEKQTTTTVFSAESKLERIQDYTYPIVEWHPTGEAIAFYTEIKGEVKFFVYRLFDKSLNGKPVKGFDKILSFDYSHDGKEIVASAVVGGQSDLYIFPVSGGSKIQLTDDIYDDLNPRFINKSKEIIFSSNRISDTIMLKPEINFLPQKNDIFIYNLRQVKHKFKYLKRITNTPDENEIQPFELSKGKYLFLSDKNGLYNRYLSQYDSVISHIDTATHYRYEFVTYPQSNLVTNINEQFITSDGKTMIYSIYQNNKYKVFQQKTNDDKLENIFTTTYLKIKNKHNKHKLITEVHNDTTYINGVNYQKLVVEIGVDEKVKPENDSLNLDSVIFKFKPPSYTIYKPNFAQDFILNQFDNNFLFPNYQPYGGSGSVYFNPGINYLLKIGASDLFDDYKILGGIRIPTTLNSGGEQLLMIENLRNRVDHRLIYYRQKIIQGSNFTKATTQDIRYRLSFPFSEILSLRSTVNVRQDNIIFIPYSDFTLSRPQEFYHNGGLKVELVFDNSIPIELNIRKGSRMKIFAEYLQEIGGDYQNTLNLGLDLRQYTRIKRNFIWVNRLAGATSLGNRKLLYYMGGVDNWFFRPNPDFNNDIGVDPSQNFGFQTIATPMRGFIQNTRNGNSFLLYNSELRLPVFTYFSNYPIKSDMLKHFQIIAFADVGVAWTGPHHLSPDNYFNTQIITYNPLTIKIQNLKEPIIGDFGFGLRSKIWGYFVRFDLAWGIEDFNIQKPITHLSLTLDI